jgi:hypothetical protein
MRKKLYGVLAILSFFLLFYFSGQDNAYPDVGMQDERKLEVPPPLEIRDFEPQPNRLMAIEYANERVFIFQIEKIIPRPECNQVKVDSKNRVRITTQAVEQAYEYVLKPVPVMVSEWVNYQE